MKKWVKSILSIVLAVATALTVGVTYVPQQVDAATPPGTFDDQFIQSWSASAVNNGWQIISKAFEGYDTGSTVTASLDAKSNTAYSYANGNGYFGDFRMSNTVLSTDVENEFMMYTCLEPKISWQEVLELTTIECTNAGNGVTPPSWLHSGHVTYLVPEEDAEHHVAINLRYYTMIGSTKLYLTDVITMWGKTQDVPNGTAAFGNPLITQEIHPGSPNGTFGGVRKFDIRAGEVVDVPIDAAIYQKFDFSLEPVRGNTYTANVNTDKHIDLYDDSFVYRGNSCGVDSNGMITWNMSGVDLGKLSYTKSGDVIVPEGCLKRTENGKVTYYRKDAYQMTYKFALDVTDNGFVSCENGDSTTDTSAAFSNQVTSAQDNASKGAKLTYLVGGNSSGNYTGYLNPNFVKGLLYDVKFDKVVKDSSIPLEGVRFKLTRKAGDGSGTKSDTRQYTFQHGNENPNVEITESDGSIRFKNMPWGYYELTEISLNGSDSFQQDYLVNAEQGKLPKGIPALDSKATGTNDGTAAVGWVIRGNNSDGKLVENGGDKLADQGCNPDYQMYVFQPNEFNRREGFVENEPYWAEVTVKKKVEKYDQLIDSLKNTKFGFKTKGDDTTYKYPVLTDTEKKEFGENDASLKHGEQVTYKVMIPRTGADIDINEILSGDAKKSFTYKESKVTGDYGTVTQNKTGVTVHAVAGYSGDTKSFTAEITNIPVTKLYIKKVIDNYQSGLANDEFMINISNQSGSVDTGVVLKHNETTGPAIIITQAGSVNIDEIIPEEYTWVRNEVTKGSATVSGKTVNLELGDEVTIAVHNKYDWKPYFHDFDTKANNFNHSTQK